MKVTARGGHGYASHNDRSLKTDPRVVDSERTPENWYMTYESDEWSHEVTKPFKQLELEYYKAHYEEALQDRNKKYKAKGNHKKVKTIEEYYRSDAKKPHEQVLQIGNNKDGVPRDDAVLIMNAFIGYLKDTYGEHMKILNCAIHMDELTCHAHLRYVMEYNGQINQDKALEALGIEKRCTRTDTDEVKYSEMARYNNRAIGFQKELQDRLYDCVKEYYRRQNKTINLEREPLLPTEEVIHTTNHEYYERLGRDLAQQKQELAEMQARVERELLTIKESKRQYEIYKKVKEQDDIIHQL